MNKKVAAPVLKTENGRGESLRGPRDTPLSAKVGTTSPTGGGRSVGIVRSRTKATEFSFSLVLWIYIFFWRCDPTRAMASSLLRFLYHTQRRTTLGRTLLDE